MENPYQTPEADQVGGGPPSMLVKPSQVTVFGIIHLIAALFGFGGIIAQKLIAQSPKAAILDSFQQNPKSEAQFTPEALDALNEALSLNLYFEIFTVILAAMLLTSGLAMLLNARWGIGLSNKYSLLSIVLKIVTIILLIAIAMPAYQKFCDGISGIDENLLTTLCIIYKFSGVGSAVVMMVYPITSWIFLTRKKVKDYQQSL